MSRLQKIMESNSLVVTGLDFQQVIKGLQQQSKVIRVQTMFGMKNVNTELAFESEKFRFDIANNVITFRFGMFNQLSVPLENIENVKHDNMNIIISLSNYQDIMITFVNANLPL